MRIEAPIFFCWEKKLIWNDSLFLRLHKLDHKCNRPPVEHLPHMGGGVFAQITTVFAHNTTVFTQNTTLFAINTTVFAQNTTVLAQNTTIVPKNTTVFAYLP